MYNNIIAVVVVVAIVIFTIFICWPRTTTTSNLLLECIVDDLVDATYGEVDPRKPNWCSNSFFMDELKLIDNRVDELPVYQIFEFLGSASVLKNHLCKSVEKHPRVFINLSGMSFFHDSEFISRHMLEYQEQPFCVTLVSNPKDKYIFALVVRKLPDNICV